MSTSRTISAALAVLVPAILGGYFSPSAQADLAAAASRVVARNDEATLPAGTSARVAVLANDRFTGKRSEVQVTGIPVPDRDGLVVGLSRQQKLIIKTFPSTDPGEYIVSYRLIGSGGHKDWAKVSIVVVPAA